jgi:hypothetical protein
MTRKDRPESEPLLIKLATARTLPGGAKGVNGRHSLPYNPVVVARGRHIGVLRPL